MAPSPVDGGSRGRRAHARDRALDLTRRLTVSTLAGATVLGLGVAALAARASAGTPDTAGAGQGLTPQDAGTLPADTGSSSDAGSGSALTPDQGSSSQGGFSAPRRQPVAPGFGSRPQAVSGGSGH